MKKQEEVPSEKREVIETYRNFRIYKMEGGYEAFASSHHEMVGWMSSKSSGKAIEQLKPTRIERLILSLCPLVKKSGANTNTIPNFAKLSTTWLTQKGGFRSTSGRQKKSGKCSSVGRMLLASRYRPTA